MTAPASGPLAAGGSAGDKAWLRFAIRLPRATAAWQGRLNVSHPFGHYPMTTRPAVPRAALILAAGKGERMKSPTPKVLHPVGGRPMLDHAIDAAQDLGCERVVVVVGAHARAGRAPAAAGLGEAAIVVQDPPLGTGHAVLAAKEALEGF